MSFELPQNLLSYVSAQNLAFIVAAFFVGLLFAKVISFFGSGRSSKKRDPRDDRIRSLEAELRVAQSAAAKSRDEVDALQEALEEAQTGIERRDNVITEQQSKLDVAAQDLKDSVIKTRELRAELAERATENVHAEAKIREVETELSVAQASQDLLATGVLDYKFSPDDEDDQEGEEPEASGAST